MEKHVSAYLRWLAALYRQLGGLWLRELERQLWREQVAGELEQLAQFFDQPVLYLTVRPATKNIQQGDGPPAAVVPSDLALAFLRNAQPLHMASARLGLRGCANRAATCAELATLTMGLHYNPEAPAYIECSPFCGNSDGAIAAWGAIASGLTELARTEPRWAPTRDAYSREVLMLIGGQGVRGG